MHGGLQHSSLQNQAPQANGLQPPSNNDYAPSIAPSERSNIGQAPRYRPVTTHGDATSSTGTLLADPLNRPRSADMIKARIGDRYGKGRPKTNAMNDDDEENWRGGNDRRSKWKKSGSGAGLNDFEFH